MGRVQSEVMDVGEPWGPEGCRGGIIIDYIRERESELLSFCRQFKGFFCSKVGSDWGRSIPS